MNLKKYLTIVLVSVFVFAAVFGGILFAKFSTSPFTQGEHGNSISPVLNNKINVLIVGKDKDEYNTDTILVATLNVENKRISLLSVPRDTRVNVNGSNMKINGVYSYANVKGLNDEELLIDTVSKVTSVPINYYMIVNLEAFRQIVDSLGGVEYDLKRDYNYNDPVQDLHIALTAGKQVLYGEQAEGLVRYRADYPRADLERIEVQQDFMKEMIKQKLKLEYITKIPSIYKNVSDNVISNLTLNEVLKYGEAIRGIKDDGLESFTLPGSATMISGVSYYISDSDEVQMLIDQKF